VAGVYYGGRSVIFDVGRVVKQAGLMGIRAVGKLWPEMVIVVVSLILLGVYAGHVPGLHYDEAWVIRRAGEIADGLRPVNGMTPYAGALHQYIMCPLFEVFGYRIQVLRIVSAMFNTTAVVLAMLLVRHFYPTRHVHRFAGLLLCTTPGFVMFSRYSGDVQTLSLFLVTAGLLLIAKAAHASSVKAALLAAVGGVCFGVLSYNHIIAITVPVAFMLSMLVNYRLAVLRSKAAWFAGAGFVMGFSVRIYQACFGDSSAQWTEKLSEGSPHDLIPDLPNLPGVLNNILNGSLLYQRFVGQVALWVLPYMTVALVLLLVGRYVCTENKAWGKPEKVLILFIGLLVFLVVVISPNFTPHYFLIPLYLTALLMTSLAVPYLRDGKVWVRRLGVGVLSTVVVLNVFYLANNYFGAFLRTGGTLSVFKIGTRLVETSNNSVRTDRLYDQLSARGVKTVVADAGIIAPLTIYDLGDRGLRFLSRAPASRRTLRDTTAVIFYNGTNLFEKHMVEPPDERQLRFGAVRYRHDPSFDPHFKVFIADPRAH